MTNNKIAAAYAAERTAVRATSFVACVVSPVSSSTASAPYHPNHAIMTLLSTRMKCTQRLDYAKHSLLFLL
jgi:hypothetical protein